jgi:IS5 family transposase
VIRDLRRKVPRPDESLETLLALCERLHAQEKTDRKKLYSLHEPDVMCISKGKAHKRYEFGQKISVTTTNRGNWIVGVDLCEGNPYDGHTLTAALATVERTTRVKVTDAYVDKGYRGHGYEGDATVHLAGSSLRGLTRTQQKRRRRRSAVEPKIGHLKSDHRMRRCFLKGLIGDAINAVLAAAGSNLLKLLRAYAHALIFWLWSRLTSRDLLQERSARGFLMAEETEEGCRVSEARLETVPEISKFTQSTFSGTTILLGAENGMQLLIRCSRHDSGKEWPVPRVVSNDGCSEFSATTSSDKTNARVDCRGTPTALRQCAHCV